MRKICIFLAMTYGGLFLFPSMGAGQTSQTLRINTLIDNLAGVSISPSSLTLTIPGTGSGGLPFEPADNSNTMWAVTTNMHLTLRARLNSPMPAGTQLWCEAAPCSGGAASPLQLLTTAQANLVTPIAHVYQASMPVHYQFKITNPLAPQSFQRVVTFELLIDSGNSLPGTGPASNIYVVTQTLNFVIANYLALTVTPATVDLIIDSSKWTTPGQSSASVTESSARFGITSNVAGAKITGYIDSDLPEAMTLRVRFNAPPEGGTSPGYRLLDVTAKDLLTLLPAMVSANNIITYELTVAAGVTPQTYHRTAIYTLTEF